MNQTFIKLHFQNHTINQTNSPMAVEAPHLHLFSSSPCRYTVYIFPLFSFLYFFTSFHICVPQTLFFSQTFATSVHIFHILQRFFPILRFSHGLFRRTNTPAGFQSFLWFDSKTSLVRCTSRFHSSDPSPPLGNRSIHCSTCTFIVFKS